MRNTILIGMILVLGSIQAADFQVGATQRLAVDLEQAAYFPSYSTSGQAILFSGAGYQGLWLLQPKTGKVQQISSAPGSGYEPLSLEDGSIVYREDSYVKGRKFTSLMRHLNGASQTISQNQRFVSQVRVQGQSVTFYSGTDLNVFDLQTETMRDDGSSKPTLVNDKLTLVLQQDGLKRQLSPVGEGQVVWAELSPSANRILFTKVGVGTFVCNLQGKILTELGTARAPKWSPDGQFIVYMVDLDDGSRYTASEIWVTDALGKEKWQITDTPQRIELYPQWSPTGDRVVYHTTQGELYETDLEIRN